MTKKEEEKARKAFQKRFEKNSYHNKTQRNTTRHVDGRHFHLSSMGAGGGLVLEESEFEEELRPQPSPAPRRAAFASILEEAKAVSKKRAPFQRENKEDQTVKNKAAQPDRVVRRPQLLNQPATSGITKREGSENKLRDHTAGIGFVRVVGVSTAVPVCEKEHIRVICHWSYSDPINRRGTWHLEQADHRDISENGFEDHLKCKCKDSTELLKKLGWRMIDDFEQHEDDDWDRLAPKEKESSRRARGLLWEKNQTHKRVVRELGVLVADAMRGTDDMGNAGRAGVAGTRCEEKGNGEKENEGNKSKKNQRDDKDTPQNKKEAGQAAELSRLSRLMKDQAKRKAADRRRARRLAQNQAKKPNMAKSAGLMHDSVLKRPHGFDQTDVGRATTRQRGQVLENHLKAGQRKLNKTTRLEMTEEEQEALKSIQAAEREEIDQLDQAEWDDEARQHGEDGGAAESEEELDNGLEAALLDALQDASPEAEPAKKQPPRNAQRRTPDSKLLNTMSVPDESQASPLTGKRKERPKQRARPIVEDSSEESDSIKAPKPCKPVNPKSKLKAPPKTKKPTMKFAEYLLAKSAGKTRVSETKELEKSDKASKALENPETEETKNTETKAGKLLKSTECIADNDLEDDAKDDVGLATNKSNNEQVSAELTNTGTTVASAEQDGDYVETRVEPTFSVEIQHQHVSIERTGAMGNTTLNHGSADQDGTTVTPGSTIEIRTSPPTSPGAASLAPSTSSPSSKKRKTMWSGSDSEVTIRLEGLKRVKRVRFSEGLRQGDAAEAESRESESKGSKDAAVESEASALEVSIAQAEGESDNYDYLFDESPRSDHGKV